MSKKIYTSDFTIGFSNLIVWVENKKCCGCTSSKKKKRDLNSSYESYKNSLDIKSSFQKIKNSIDPELKNKSQELEQEIKKDLSNEIKEIIEEESEIPIKDRSEIAILKSLNGIIRSGSMTAIIGSSGSGKTTLMNFLSSRSNWDANMYVDGDLFLNGQPVKNLSKYKHLMGFVPQEDILHEEATVRENLEIYGQLRAIPDYKAKAQKLIEDLGLTKCADTIIGNSMIRGVSGGERKRTCVAIELISDPKVLFLDEPTTGIDAYTALEVMRCLKKLNEEKKVTVVTILHQPRQEIIDLFDQVGYLGEGP